MEVCQWVSFGPFYLLDNSKLRYVDSLMCYLSSKKNQGEGVCVEECITGRKLPLPRHGDLVIFLEWVVNS